MSKQPLQVASYMTHAIVTCAPSDSLERAAQLMWDRDIGCVIVVDDDDRVAGIVTDRDACMAAYTRGEPLRAIPVAVAMATTVYTCRPEDELGTVDDTMRLHQIRRMPVVDGGGHPIGMISLSDLARGARHDPAISPAAVAATLAEVSTSRPTPPPAD